MKHPPSLPLLVVVVASCALRHPADPVDDQADARPLARIDVPYVGDDVRPVEVASPDVALVDASVDDQITPVSDRAEPDLPGDDVLEPDVPVVDVVVADVPPDVPPPPPDVPPPPPDVPPPPPDVPPPPPDVMTCGPGQMLCAGRCVNTSNDVNNCGGCGVVCGSRTHVSTTCPGRCAYACEPGWQDCNLNPSDGCECNTGCLGLACVPPCGGRGQICCASLNPCASGQRCTGPWIPPHCCANNERWCGRCSTECF